MARRRNRVLWDWSGLPERLWSKVLEDNLVEAGMTETSGKEGIGANWEAENLVIEHFLEKEPKAASWELRQEFPREAKWRDSFMACLPGAKVYINN